MNALQVLLLTALCQLLPPLNGASQHHKNIQVTESTASIIFLLTHVLIDSVNYLTRCLFEHVSRALLTYLFDHSPTHSCVYPVTYSPTVFAHLFTCSPTYLTLHLPTCLPIHLLVHPLI